MRARRRSESESDVGRYQTQNRYTDAHSIDGGTEGSNVNSPDREGLVRVKPVDRLRGRVSPRSDDFGGGGHRGGLRRGRSPEQREVTRREHAKVTSRITKT